MPMRTKTKTARMARQADQSRDIFKDALILGRLLDDGGTVSEFEVGGKALHKFVVQHTGDLYWLPEIKLLHWARSDTSYTTFERLAMTSSFVHIPCAITIHSWIYLEQEYSPAEYSRMLEILFSGVFVL